VLLVALGQLVLLVVVVEPGQFVELEPVEPEQVAAVVVL
jgi:hypothetical protein